jgi:hypothetical protein
MSQDKVQTSPDTLVKRIFGAVCKEVGSEYATAAAKLPLRALASLAMPDPRAYHEAYRFGYDYLVYSYLRKYAGGSDEQELRTKAELSFKETESAVRDTNRRLRFGSVNNGVEGLLSRAKRKITQILGFRDSSDFPFGELALSCGWGKGATFSLNANRATLDKKILEPALTVTPRCLRYASAFLNHDSSWFSARVGQTIEGAYCVLPSEFEIVRGGRFDSVPKDTKTRRAIDVQPTLNLFFQKGVGSMIRRRLKRFGIDLDDQTRNQELARLAITSGLSTIDLAKASDTVSSQIVYLLLPPCWFEVLDDLRTDEIRMSDGSWLRLEKFSSMGNGFTFELESLIFYALALAVAEEQEEQSYNISVYGDDIIVPRRIVDRLIQGLEYSGFSVNLEKSFIDGRFFESCGKHYFDGSDVTPIFQKEVVVCLPSAIRCANRILRWAYRMGQGLCLDSIAKSAFEIARSHAYERFKEFEHKISNSRRRRGQKFRARPMPTQPLMLEGDSGLITLRQFHRNWHGSVKLTVLDSIPNRVRADDYALYAHTLRNGCVVETPFNGKVAKRGADRYHLTERWIYLPGQLVPDWV